MNSADKPNEGVNSIGIELIKQDTVATSAFLKPYEHSLDEAVKTDLRHKLVARGQSLLRHCTAGQPPLNSEDAADQLAFKSRNALVQQIAVNPRYNWAEQVLYLERLMHASYLFATYLMELTKIRMTRFQNCLAYRGTWSKL